MKQIHFSHLKKFQKASTLVKLLIIITLISIILTITIVATNPSRQIAQANNTKRSGDVIKILNALHQYAADNQGRFPPQLPAPGSEAKTISKSGADICSDLVPKYISSLPSDPTGTNGGINTDCSGQYNTGYTVSIGTTMDTITITAPNTQLPLKSFISASR